MTFQDRVRNDKSIYDLLRDEKYFIEQYQRIESFLLTIREEKIWKNCKYNDAIFTYEQLKETTSCLFQPLINIYDIEVKFLQYLLCPIESLFIEVENRCDTTLEEITILKSILPNHRNHNNQKILDTVNIEYILMESEIILLQAVIDLKRSNVTASAHKFLKSYQKMIEIKKTLNDYYEYNDKKTKYETAYFLQMVENRPLICDQKLLQALNHLIQEKIQELRIEYSLMSSNGGHNGDIVINDDTLQSTRDLLHLKQLYQQLSCEYQKYEEERQLLQKELNKGSRKRKSVKSLSNPNKKDDNHSTLVDENNHPNTNIPVRGRSASTTVLSSKVPLGNSNQPKKSIFDGRNIAASFNLSSVSETCGNIISNAVDKISTSINSSHQATAANAPNATSEKKIISNHNNENEELVNSIMSPKKVEMPVVSVLLPRMSDVAKMFDFESTIDIKRRKSQHTTNETTTGGGQKGVKSNSLAHLDLAQVKSQNSPSSKSLKQIVNPDDLDFHRLHSVFDNDFYELFFIQSKSRISFIESIFTIGLALLPKNSQWVLEIVNVSSNTMHITKAISLLYKLHHYDNHRWNKLVTLVLINIPHHLYEQVWTDNHHTFPFLVNDFNNVNHIEQIYQIIEAQSIIKPWTGRNPLWLASLARQSSVMTRVHENVITTNIHKRIDYYRRIITLEKDTLPIDHTLGFYEFRNLLARDLLRTGNWILALQQSRELLERLKNSIPSLYNYALIQSSTAALILTEFFNCQKVFLPLKFANNKFIHNENLVAAAAPSTLPAGMISIDHSSYQYDEISDIIAAFNFQQYLGSMRQYMNVMMIPFEYQTLFHRISEYEDYHGMLVLEEKKRQQEKEAEEEETSATVDTEEQPIESPTETQEIEEIDVIEEIKQSPGISNSHEANELMQKRKEENLKVDYYCFWSWLMPLETIYLLLRPFGFVHEAAHSSLLSICDKGGLLFADKYLIKSWELAQQLAAQQAAASTTINSADMMILDYPVLSSETTISDQPKIVTNRADEPYQQMGYFIKSIIIDEIVAKDPSVVRKAIYPTNKLKLYFEEIIMTGDKQLRIDCEENYSTLFSVSGKPSGNGSAGSGSSFNPFSTSSAASTNSSTTGGGFFQMLQTPLLSENSLLSGLASRMNIGGGPDRYALDMKAVKVLQKIKERHEHYNIELKPFYQQAQHLVDRESLKVKKSEEEDSDDKESEEDDMYRWIRLEAPKKPQKVYGDQLLTWLLLRGLILLELNRIGEAIMMFKLMECYKETAPRTKFAMFVGYYHLAEIVLQYDVCDFPILVAAEYLKRASVYLQRAYESKCYHYIHEYHPKILALTQKLLTSTTSNA